MVWIRMLDKRSKIRVKNFEGETAWKWTRGKYYYYYYYYYYYATKSIK